MKRLWLILFVLPLFAQEPLKYSINFPEITQSNMPVLFLMHGYGSNEKQFNKLIEELNNKYLIVSMRAPFNFMVIKNRWYEYSISDGDTLSNQTQIDLSTKRIIKTIEHIKEEYNIDEKKIFIGGFSQGGAMAQIMLLSQISTRISGLVLLGTRSIEEQKLRKTLRKLKPIPVLWMHGLSDEIIKYEESIELVNIFEDEGWDVVKITHKKGHVIPLELHEDVKKFIQEVFSNNS